MAGWYSVGKMPDSVLQLDSAAADRNTETVSANSAAGWRRFLACLDTACWLGLMHAIWLTAVYLIYRRADRIQELIGRGIHYKCNVPV